MKIAALALLLSGWLIAVAALALLRSAPRAGFIFAGTAVALLGLALLFRAHMAPRGERA